MKVAVDQSVATFVTFVLGTGVLLVQSFLGAGKIAPHIPWKTERIS